MTGGSRLVLASGSKTRLALLRAAGLDPEVVPPTIDEEEIKTALRAEGADGAVIAETLAEHKAQQISRRVPDRLVLGADQVLEFSGGILSKPENRAVAREQLIRLRNSDHSLISSACIALNGERIWHHLDRARLTMRNFSDAFVEFYLDRIGSDALSGPGAYRIEGVGIQLFSRIEGDHSTILGLPLLPLLDYLRARSVVRM